MTDIAWLYQNVQGVAQDHAEAMKWFQKAAATGFTPGMITFGGFYGNGSGGRGGSVVTQDSAEARRWYQSRGSPQTQQA